MIITSEQRKEQAEDRINLRCSVNTLTNVITMGTNCSAFEAQLISAKAQQVFHLGEYSDKATLQPGQMIWQAISQDEPAGKPLKACQYKRIILSIHRLDEDRQAHGMHGATGKRQQQILRITEEALQQTTLLTIEDLGILLDCNEKTIRNDIKALKKKSILVPTRGTKKDIGPGMTHRDQCIHLFLEGHEPLDISKRMTHSLTSVERYIDSFCRIIYCLKQENDIYKTALITGMSTYLVKRCIEIRDKYQTTPHYKKRVEEIEKVGKIFWQAQDEKKTRMGNQQAGEGDDS